MNLQQELKDTKKRSKENVSKEQWDIMVKSTEQLIKEHLSNNTIKIGENMIDFELPNALGTTTSLSSQLKKGKIVISFYRGGWCPYCNLELKALQEILPEIEKNGASLIAISPETPDNSLDTTQKNELKFSVLSDINNVLSKKLGLVFQMPKDLREVYHSFNLDVPKHNGNTDYELPMPATFVLDKKGTIIYAFVSEDYTERANQQEIINLLKTK